MPPYNAYSDSKGRPATPQLESDGSVPVTLKTGEIEIGAVEIKDHDGTDHAAVDSSNRLSVAVGIDSQTTFDHGSNLDVDTSAEALTTTSFAAKRGVVVKAASTNTGIIYVGNSDVTDGDTAATDGIPLAAGESLEIEVSNPNTIYVIASVVNQKVFWLAI